MLFRFFGAGAAVYLVTILVNYLVGSPVEFWTVVLTSPFWRALGFAVGRGVTIDQVRRRLRPAAYMVGCYACGWREVPEDPSQTGPRRAHHAEHECPARQRRTPGGIG